MDKEIKKEESAEEKKANEAKAAAKAAAAKAKAASKDAKATAKVGKDGKPIVAPKTKKEPQSVSAKQAKIAKLE